MLDECKKKSMMVEYNLMSVALTCISDRIQTVLRLLLPNFFPEDFKAEQFPQSNNAEVICDTMIEAIKFAGLKGRILMIVKETELNIYDQRMIEMGILNRGNQIVRASFGQLVQGLRLNEETFEI